MATATGTPRTTTPRDPRVYHPLDQLRGIVRRYVVIEGLLSAVIFLAVWYVVALLLDYGVFKALTWDWVQDGTWWIRAVALVIALVLLGGIVVFRIVRRLTTEFSYPSLALVLERRFPKVLGDRLITAVELADVEQATRHGYSAEMIRQTIDEARDRVGKVPVHDAFNWRRLRIMGLIAGGLVLLVVVVAFASHAIAVEAFRPVQAGWKFIHVTSILAERDLLLMNTPWPRRALIELQDVPETGIRVARDGAAPRVKVKSYQWVIADRSRPDGWRPLLWSDVNESLVGIAVPHLPFASLGLPDEKLTLPPEPSAWTVDAVWERARDSAPVRDKLSQAMGGSEYLALQNVLDRLEQMANEPSRGRTLRHLDRPASVAFEYVGSRTGGGGTFNPEGNSEYAGEIGGLREDVQFVVKAEDFRTPPRAIALIPPPTLTSLTRIEFQPAYLHYAPPLIPDPDRPGEMVAVGHSWFKGKRQRMREEKLSLTGDKSVFVVPAGTELTITGVTELPIARAYAQPRVGKVPGAKPGSAQRVPLPVRDENSFSIEFKGDARLTSGVEFDLVFENSDKVTSTRQVLIQVTEDQAPVVEIAPEVIRRVGTLYYVTPRAKIPFNPESYLRDDTGLSKVEYTVSYWPEDSSLTRAIRAGLITRAIIAPSGLPTLQQASVMQGAYHTSAFRFLDRGDNRLMASFLLGSFLDLENKLKRETRDRLENELLPNPSTTEKPGLVTRLGLKTNLTPEVKRRPNGSMETFKWRIDGDYFDVRALGLEVPSGDVQPRYQIELNVRATDVNFDSGPKSSVNPEPLRLLVISSGDLLVEISKEQEALGTKLDDAIKKIQAARKKYEFVRSKNGFVGLDELDVVKVRSRDATQDVGKAKEAVQAIAREFRRIERECVFNQIDEKTVVAFGRYANRLDRVMGEQPLPVSPDEDDFIAAQDEEIKQGKQDPRPAFPVTEKLIGVVQTALDEGRWADAVNVTDAEIAINRLEKELIKLREDLGEGESFDKVKREIQSVLEQQRRIKAEMQRLKREIDDVTLQDTPEIHAVGPVFLAKGESKKIRHNIRWRQFKEDSLAIKVTSSDPAALIVPSELKLDFEKNDLSFEYDVRAATKEGEYTITLTPAAGAKVQVRVTVK